VTSSGNIAVVVSSHRLYPTLELCLRGFQAILPKPQDLIFVQNGPSPGLEHLIATHFPLITKIPLVENGYFCAGYNAGLRFALERDYEFVLIVNADTEVANPSFLSDLLRAAERWPRAAFLGPLVYLRTRDAVQTTCLRFPSILYHALIWIPWRMARGLVPSQPTRECEVEFLNGVCVLCRASALGDIGLMDETFGGYSEDADWSWRARSRRWTSVFVPTPSVIHHEEHEGYEPFSLKNFLLRRNTLLWFLKTGRKGSALFYACVSLILAWARARRAGNQTDKQKHRHFIGKLSRSYRGLLRGEEPGPWFGPPLGRWENADRLADSTNFAAVSLTRHLFAGENAECRAPRESSTHIGG
jgi:N-acetylglucosaminyl-diphospho-decaprenol L-rhamnosyltransferase